MRKTIVLQVAAGFFVNVAAGWFLAIFVSRDLWVLTIDIVFTILSLSLAYQTEFWLTRFEEDND